MKITNRQKEEIEFLCKHFGGNWNDAEEYIKATVHGETAVSDKLSNNSLRVAKTKLDRQIKWWREDLDNGLLAPFELEEEFNDAHGKRVVASVLASTKRNNLFHFVAKNAHSKEEKRNIIIGLFDALLNRGMLSK